MSGDLIQWGGVILIIAFVFIETGFLLGLVVPGGETLLFTAGLFIATDTLDFPLFVLILILIGAGFLGDCMGYWVGMKVGNKLHKKKDNWLFKKEYLEKAEAFYRKHQKSALIIGRFLPIIRTFNPLLSGSSKLALNKFLPLTGIGVIAYVSALVLLGYLLGNAFPALGDYVEYIFLGVAIIVIGTLVFNLVKSNREQNKRRAL
jgi:membrane-associated protein